MKVYYHDLGDEQFEQLVITVCSVLLGPGIHGFSKGPDGGKDALFVGTASLIPSPAQPWNGRIVVQAKHTDSVYRKFSEPDFAGEGETSVVSKEIPRIRALRERGELDYYLLFANRRLAGAAEEKVRERIARETGVPAEAIRLVGEEDLDRYLNWYPEILQRARLNLFDEPPLIDPRDLAVIIRAFAANRETIGSVADGLAPPPQRRTTLAEKNRINGLSADYADVIRPYIKDFGEMRAFLAAPENAVLVESYQGVVDDLNGLIAAYRTEEHTFDRVLERLFRLMVDRDYDLRTNKRLTRTVLYYMYWNCDLGKDGDDPAE